MRTTLHNRKHASLLFEGEGGSAGSMVKGHVLRGNCKEVLPPLEEKER